MENKGYPDYVPEYVTNLYETHKKWVNDFSIQSQEDRPEEFDRLEKKTKVLHELIYHENMDTVWRRLWKREKKRDVDAHTHVTQYGVALVANAIMEGLHGGSPWEPLTPKVRETEGDALVKEIRNLSRKLAKYCVNERALGLLTEGEEVEIVRWGGLMIGATKEQVDYFEKRKCQIAMPLGAININLSMAAMLKRCANQFEADEPHKKAHLRQPGHEGSKLILFVRTLGKYIKNRYGLYLYETIANIASIFFPDDDIDEDKVRFILKKRVRT